MVDDPLRVGDVRDLHAFELATQLRSLAAVARITGESTATVSRRLSRLEAALGVALLRRSSRGIAPTDDGLAYRPRVAHILELLGAANAEASHRARAAPTGTLRISIPPGLTDALAPMLASFSAAYAQVTLIVDVSSRFVDLEAERFDLAVRATARLADSSLVAVRVTEPGTEGILVCAPAYAARCGTPRRLGELAAHRILALTDAAIGYRMPVVRRGTTRVVQIALPVAIAGSDLGFLKTMALAGAGIASLPRVMVRRELDDERLVHILPSYVWPTGGLYLVHRGGPYVAPKVRAFLDHMKASLG